MGKDVVSYGHSLCRICGWEINDSTMSWTKHYQRIHKFKGIE